jgi:2'-5' RNA ligase
LAIEIDAGTRSAITDLLGRFRAELPRISWTRPENAHLTLRFFGEVVPEFIEGFAIQLRPFAARMQPVGARVSGVGAFPNARRPSIVWAGMEFDGDGITRLQQASENIARQLGLPPETRAFVPHVTVGRVRRDAPHAHLTAALQRESRFSANAFTVDAVSLFSSELTPQGARYTRLHRFTFDGIRSESGV